MKGIIHFWGDRGTSRAYHVVPLRLDFFSSEAAFNAFVGVLGGYTTCNIGEHYAYDVSMGTPAPPYNNSNMDEFAQIYYRMPYFSSTRCLMLPSWDLTGHPLVAGPDGDRIDPADVEAIINALDTATDKEMIPLWGRHIKIP